MSKELRQGKIMVGDTQIGNSPVIYEIDDNVNLPWGKWKSEKQAATFL